ncbi:MAG: DUF502 domain-containing protein [Gammaproteobacteria bacterium]|nr:DUF502 domain-containing protein [Gammaproteobacteria bacterium]
MKQLMSWLGKGMLAVVPALVTLYALIWLVSTLEGLLGVPLEAIFGARVYIPGMGLLLAVGLLIGIGVLIDLYVGRLVIDAMEAMIDRVPVVKSIYGAVRDLLQFAIPGKDEEARRVVAWECKPGVWMVGFVTGPAFVPVGNDGEDRVSVYFPMSYQIGGYTFLLPESELTTLDMTVEDAMKGVLTAGVMGRENPER